MYACLQRSWVQPALLRLQHAMVGRMGEKGLRGGRYSEMYGASSDEGQAVAHDTCDRIPMQKYVFPSTDIAIVAKVASCGDQVFFEQLIRILYIACTYIYICCVEDQLIASISLSAKGWFSNRMEFIISYRSNFSLSLLDQ